jgi:flagellar motor switch protein FliG
MAGELATANSLDGVLSAPPATRPFQSAKPDVLERAIAATTQAPIGDHKNSRKGPNRDQKAAIIVRLLHSTTGESPFATLDTGLVTRLVHAMAGLTYVDEATILTVIQDFLTDIDSFGLYFQPGVEGAIATLGGLVTEDVTARLAYTPTIDQPDDPWVAIAAMEIDTIVGIISQETPQVGAIVLSKLSAVKAAEILAELTPELGQAIAQSALEIGRIGITAVNNIGRAITDAANATQDLGALPGDPVERVGAMLNFAPSLARESLLSGLEDTDAELADQVRKTMFTFRDIPDRIEIKDVPKVVRAVENEVIVTALAGGVISERDTVDFIYANLSKRLSEQLTEEVGDIGEVKPKDADRAMNALVQGIRDLENAGEITLITPEQ